MTNLTTRRSHRPAPAPARTNPNAIAAISPSCNDRTFSTSANTAASRRRSRSAYGGVWLVIVTVGLLLSGLRLLLPRFNATPDVATPHKKTQNEQQQTQQQKELDENWCSRVEKARIGLRPSLQVQVPCEKMTRAAKSAVVCMLTDGVPDDSKKKSRVVFTATNYIHGAMALGASLASRIDPTQTHLLLLIRQGFELAASDHQALSAVGWTIGVVPTVPLEAQYTPRFPRYKTTYTKIAAIGLGEYDCVLLMDADTLAVGSNDRLQDLLTCRIFSKPHHRVGGTLDWFRGHWQYFNTGSILWRPSSAEMERVFDLTTNPSFMKRFSSDQDFLNNVYPERLNNTYNNILMKEGSSDAAAIGNEHDNQVVDMTWDFNAQTHVEVERPEWWDSHRSTVQILHFTEKKGWQCPERHDELSSDPPIKRKCTKEEPDCFCLESHLYWNALSKAKAMAGVAQE